MDEQGKKTTVVLQYLGCPRRVFFFFFSVFPLCCKVTGASPSYSWDKTPNDGPTICPSLIKVEHMLMQPLCSLRVLLLSQGQNWIAPGDCIFPYAWHFGCIMPPHVRLFNIFLPFGAERFLGNWKKKKKKISWARFFLILLTFPLSIITPGSSILWTLVSLICGDTGVLLVTL